MLEVIPGDLPGMDYSVRGMICDHQVSALFGVGGISRVLTWHAQVYFSLRKKRSNLVIRAKRKQVTGDSDIIELIPQEKLEGDLPAVLIKGHAHWLNLSTSVLEIRPLDSLWTTSSENWKITCTPGK